VSKADEMFKELGLKKYEEEKYIHYKNETITINFFKDIPRYFISNYHSISLKLHLAIHEKMKELGWIES
jgi:hypothetical protein